MTPERRRSQEIVKFAFVVAPIIYTFVAWLRPAPPEPMNPAVLRTMTQVLAGVYALLVILVAPRMKRDQGGMVARLAIYESGAIFGLMLTFLGGQILYAMGFGAVAMLLMLSVQPPGEVGTSEHPTRSE